MASITQGFCYKVHFNDQPKKLDLHDNTLGHLKLLVTTGVKNATSLQNTVISEVISLNEPLLRCQRLMDCPLSLAGATGALLDGNTPTICGGFSSSTVDKCYSYHKDGWWNARNLTLPRFTPANVVLDNGRTLCVTGGFNGSKVTDTIDLVTLSSSRTSGPMELPVALTGHCMVRVFNRMTFVIGGYRSIKAGNSTWILNQSSIEWTIGPDLNIGRSEHACGYTFIRSTGFPAIVAAGGYPALDSAEILFAPYEEWKQYKLPKGIRSASGVSYNGDFLLIGGFDGKDVLSTIYRLGCRLENCHWSLMEQQLQVARSSAVAMLIPNELTNCELL